LRSTRRRIDNDNLVSYSYETLFYAIEHAAATTCRIIPTREAPNKDAPLRPQTANGGGIA
jgi:hypothetical protein